ncbi:hypothetical protein ACDQ55_21175 [Chitinophaga sp. 30R24]|uniref:hypothetical protein n=1 Tax=Chitinophaga sp. 30R24 TaxID=3248838 RepID=UPI003B90FC73
MRKYALLLRIIVPLLVVAIGAIAYAINQPLKKIEFKADAEPVIAQQTFSRTEKELLGRLFGVFTKATASKRMLISGTLYATDPSDSAATGRQDFRYCRNNEECYYRVNEGEMIALKNMYIVINHAAKKILVSHARKIEVPFQLPNDSLIHIWEQENYKIVTTKENTDSIISFVCDNHISCKQYRYKLNFSTGEVHELYMRLTDLQDPLNPEKDKELRFVMKDWKEGEVDEQLFKQHRYVEGVLPHCQPAAAYHDYQLITSF